MTTPASASVPKTSALARIAARVAAKPPVFAPPPPLIHYKLTGASPEFARSVLKDDIYKQVVLQKEDIMATISPTDGELFSFQVHPMLGNAVHYETLLRRTGHFLAAAAANMETARAIVMFYQIYLEPVVVTSVEHYLWVCTKTELQTVVSKAGFPIGQALLEAQAAAAASPVIDKLAIVKAMVDVGGVHNCLPETDGSKFMLSIRNPAGDTRWYEPIVL